MTIKIEMEATPLNEMSEEEIIALMDKNYKVRDILREIADDYDTEWKISDIFRNCPKAVRVDDYGWKCGLSIDNTFDGVSDIDEAYKWAWLVLDDSGYQFCIDGVDDCEKIDRYLEALHKIFDYGIEIPDKDFEYMYEFVKSKVNDLLNEVATIVNDIERQFDDDYYMLDCLQSCELMDGYYVINDNLYLIDNDNNTSVCVA